MNKKENKKRIFINKKGLVDNFLALLFVVIGIAIIFGALFFFMSAKMKANNTLTASDLNIKEGLYTSRVLLNQEISADYKVYDAVIKYANGENPEIQNELFEAIKKFYPNNIITDKWLIIINENCFVIVNTGVTSSNTPVQSGSTFGQGAGTTQQITIDECERNLVYKMPKVTVPNPDGENIVVLFKPSSYLDGKSSRIFGYRADQLKGLSSETLPELSFDGRTLEKIEDIPNIECDAAETSVGKICIADQNLVQRLRVLSAEKLQPENMKMVINQAYRTYEIQKRLYEQNCGSGSCKPPTCNPDTSLTCPHMQAGAIDIAMYDSAGRKLNGEGGINPSLVESIMCEYGFVRYSPEDWHFEYGTNQWELAEEKRANGEIACTY